MMWTTPHSKKLRILFPRQSSAAVNVDMNDVDIMAMLQSLKTSISTCLRHATMCSWMQEVAQLQWYLETTTIVFYIHCLVP